MGFMFERHCAAYFMNYTTLYKSWRSDLTFVESIL